MTRARLLTRRSKDPVARALKEWLAVPPAAARVLAALYGQRGQVVPRAELMLASGQTPAGLALSIRRLREAMEPKSIANEPAVGFRLTAAGLAECERALADAAARAEAA